MRGIICLSLATLASCGPNPEVNQSAREAVLQQVAQEPTSRLLEAQPRPPGGSREPLNCCIDARSTAIMKAYLDLEQGFLLGDMKGVAQKAHALALACEAAAESDTMPTITPKVASRIAFAAEKLRASSPEVAREYFAEISGLLVREVGITRGGEVDMAAACSLRLGWSWLQTGVELQSPYGDAPDQMSWGGCDPRQTLP
jgi:hypothetical protein